MVVQGLSSIKEILVSRDQADTFPISFEFFNFWWWSQGGGGSQRWLKACVLSERSTFSGIRLKFLHNSWSHSSRTCLHSVCERGKEPEIAIFV